jgi:hypothetical protein
MKMRTTKYTKDTKKELLSDRARHFRCRMAMAGQAVRAATSQRRAEDWPPYQLFSCISWFNVV